MSDSFVDMLHDWYKSMVAYLGSSSSYRISGSRASQEDPREIYTVHLMNLTTQDQHELQLNPNTIPLPRFKFKYRFTLPLGHFVVCVLVLFA